MPKLPPPERFPMSLSEFAVTVRLDPLLTAALSVWVTPEERLQSEWDDLLARYQARPVTR